MTDTNIDTNPDPEPDTGRISAEAVGLTVESIARVTLITRLRAGFMTPKGMGGLAILLVFAALAIAAPWLFPGGPDEQSRDSLLSASLNHPFGTDELGRDIFVRTIYALRTDLSLVFVAVPIGMTIGTILGLTGVITPWLGNLSQRLFDLILGFPGIVLGITIVTIFEPGWTSLVITISIITIPAFGRLARAALLREQQQEYVLAASVLGVGKVKILSRHILPNVLDPIVVQVSASLVLGVFIESALSLVGLGVQPPRPSLGTLLNAASRYISRQSMYVAGPTITLIVLALGLNMIADALNRELDRR
jgi:peptide/nickel transport system permease protein